MTVNQRSLLSHKNQFQGQRSLYYLLVSSFYFLKKSFGMDGDGINQ